MKKSANVMINMLATVLCGVLIAVIATPLMLPSELRLEVDFSNTAHSFNNHDDVIAHPMMMDKNANGRIEKLLKPQYDGDVQPAVFKSRQNFEPELLEV